jgi:uncharacterized protein
MIASFIITCLMSLAVSTDVQESAMSAKKIIPQNLLSGEVSPYLLQHADNPVHWYPWGEEAFDAAREQDKPIFLSIGYSTCHWCHVMAHESFEDVEVAALLNEHFISIKVDREERPDIDHVYMTVCQLMTGSGGWPLTLFLAPDQRPFYAATYIPRKNRYNRPGMMELLPRISHLWSTDRPGLMEAGNRAVEALVATLPSAGMSPDWSVLDRAAGQLAEQFDETNGGFGSGMKFPTPHQLTALLRHWRKSTSKSSLNMVTRTLDGMAAGGIHDHIGFGFHRYSTDPQWLVPHFEKMLYDQALLADAYLEAYQATGDERYATVVSRTMEYVLRNLTGESGAFLSAEDADSEGSEGRFYVWSYDELKSVLSREHLDLVERVFGASSAGNFRDPHDPDAPSTNVFFRRGAVPMIALELGLDEDALDLELEVIRQNLFSLREQRPHPHRDDKILTDWNGLMIGAMARAGRVLNDERLVSAARRAADFVLSHMHLPGNGLLHRYRNGKKGIAGQLDDYAFMANGLVELYQATASPGYLKAAVGLADRMVADFHDEEEGGFYLTATNADSPLMRAKELYDGAIPSGNSVAAEGLLKISRLTGAQGMEERVDDALRLFGPALLKGPTAHSRVLSVVDAVAGPFFELIIVADKESQALKKMVDAVRTPYLPNLVIHVITPENRTDLESIVPALREYRTLKGLPTAYVCQQFTCKAPVTDPSQMLEKMGAR